LLGFRSRRRARLRETPLGESARELIERRVAWFRRLPAEDRRELEGLVQIFLAEKRFEGCAGLVVSDEMRLVIAVQACILLLGRGADVYPGLVTILVYPHAYVAQQITHHGGIVTETESVRIGQSWRQGSLVLAWDHVSADAADVHDGHNVVFHEFAHALDMEDGAADGIPPLPSRSRYIAWARVLGAAYADLVEQVHRQHASVLDAYGATDPAEFFAVATECFFERPLALERTYPALYGELRHFYHRDPAALERGEPERRDS